MHSRCEHVSSELDVSEEETAKTDFIGSHLFTVAFASSAIILGSNWDCPSRHSRAALTSRSRQDPNQVPQPHPHPLFFSGLKNKSTAATGKHIHYVGSIYHSVKSNEPQAAFNAFPEKPEAAKLKRPL